MVLANPKYEHTNSEALAAGYGIPPNPTPKRVLYIIVNVPILGLISRANPVPIPCQSWDLYHYQRANPGTSAKEDEISQQRAPERHIVTSLAIPPSV